MRYETMTKVQQATLPVALSGVDILAKARTGTGKTLAFLIPTIENILRTNSMALVISPTRELAGQIHQECLALCTFHKNFTAQCVFGGTSKSGDLSKLRRGMPNLMVATPGRLLDHLQNSRRVFDVSSLGTLILDEADQLLEMGFRDDITKIIGCLPREHQSLLFSATVPPMVKTVAHIALKKDYEFIDCVGDDDNQTVEQVRQYMLEVRVEGIMYALCGLLEQARRECPNDYKVIVFFVTARQTGFYAEAMNAIKERNAFKVFEIHSRKSQSKRTRVSGEFRKAQRGVLFSSDVSARGLDYPNITHVIQMGAPSSREQYIHRLGRTARAGKAGKCVLVTHSWESYFLKQIKDLTIEQYPGGAPQCPWPQSVVDGAVEAVPTSLRRQCWSARLGYYNGLCRKIGWTKHELVQESYGYATRGLLLKEPPMLQKRTIGKMGLQEVFGMGGRGGGGGRRGGRR